MSYYNGNGGNGWWVENGGSQPNNRRRQWSGGHNRGGQYGGGPRRGTQSHPYRNTSNQDRHHGQRNCKLNRSQATGESRVSTVNTTPAFTVPSLSAYGPTVIKVDGIQQDRCKNPETGLPLSSTPVPYHLMPKLLWIPTGSSVAYVAEIKRMSAVVTGIIAEKNNTAKNYVFTDGETRRTFEVETVAPFLVTETTPPPLEMSWTADIQLDSEEPMMNPSVILQNAIENLKNKQLIRWFINHIDTIHTTKQLLPLPKGTAFPCESEVELKAANLLMENMGDVLLMDDIEVAMLKNLFESRVASM